MNNSMKKAMEAWLGRDLTKTQVAYQDSVDAKDFPKDLDIDDSIDAEYERFKLWQELEDKYKNRLEDKMLRQDDEDFYKANK